MAALPAQVSTAPMLRGNRSGRSVAETIRAGRSTQDSRDDAVAFNSLLDRRRVSTAADHRRQEECKQNPGRAERAETEAIALCGVAALNRRAGRNNTSGPQGALDQRGLLSAAGRFRSDEAVAGARPAVSNAQSTTLVKAPPATPAAAGPATDASEPTTDIARDLNEKIEPGPASEPGVYKAAVSELPLASGAEPATTQTSLAASLAESVPGSLGDLSATLDATLPPIGANATTVRIVSGGASTISATGAETPANIRSQVLQQVLTHEMSEGGAGRLILQLDPEQLGRVSVELRSVGQRLTIVFDAESAAAQDALREGGKELAGNLLERGGGRWTQVEVKLAERDGNQRQSETDKRRENPRQQGQHGEADGQEDRGPRHRWGG